MNKVVTKRGAGMIIFIALVMIMVFSGSGKTFAESVKMDQIEGISWDLKPGKKLKITAGWEGYGVIPGTVRISDYKIRPASMKGYYDLTFNITFTYNFKAKGIKINKAFADKNTGLSAYHYFAVVDYPTGTNLEMPNRLGVITYHTGFKSTYIKVKLKGMNKKMEVKDLAENRYSGIPTIRRAMKEGG